MRTEIQNLIKFLAEKAFSEKMNGSYIKLYETWEAVNAMFPGEMDYETLSSLVTKAEKEYNQQYWANIANRTKKT